MNFGALLAAIQAAQLLGTAGLKAIRKRQLAAEEKELLIAAADAGEFMIREVDQEASPWVVVGHQQFRSDEDRAVSARYLQAFKSLIERGYVTHVSKQLFMLTGNGFTKARETG